MTETTNKKTKKPYTERRRRGFATASKLAQGILSPAMRSKGFLQAEVVTRWPHIVGQELAGSTVPVRLVFPRGERMGAKLVVRCESAFAPLLQHRIPRIVEQVNSYFGYGAVKSVEVKQGPILSRRLLPQLEKKKLPETDRKKLDSLVGAGDTPLQAAVASLGELVLSNRKKV